tara:strand:- start:154 stop:306 length:153 start_codon:yes stop_codon:yes gene_type:complete
LLERDSLSNSWLGLDLHTFVLNANGGNYLYEFDVGAKYAAFGELFSSFWG